MQRTGKNRRFVGIISGIVLSIFLLTQCLDKKESDSEISLKNKRDQFAGSPSCANCHQSIYNSHIHTAHYLTSSVANEKSIRGSFEAGKNTFAFNNSSVIVTEKRNDEFYQVQYENGVEKKARRFDISVGSAKRGQTYLYWWKDSLFQLPLTYFTSVNTWCNSPGYPGKVAFGRPVTSRCLECHTSYAYTATADAQVEKFDHNILYGVDCEKCHGPALQHVQFQTQHPNEKIAKYITNPATFTRQQSLDLCTLCHGGRLTKTKPSFEFEAGDTLANYFSINVPAKNAADIDVHGNQFGLLAASKCFRLSQMTCISCHSSHENEAGKIEIFSARCMVCHSKEYNNFCKLDKKTGVVITQNCIDCHMPVQPSKAIVFLEQGKDMPTAASMRNHFIKIYPEETQKILSVLKNMKHTDTTTFHKKAAK